MKLIKNVCFVAAIAIFAVLNFLSLRASYGFSFSANAAVNSKNNAAANKNTTAKDNAVNKKYGAYMLKKRVVLELSKNYDLREYITESIKILSQRGINKYSEVIVPFSTKYQKIKLLYAYTVINGAFKIPLGKHAVNIVSPGFAVNYPAYSGIKYMTLSMPAVEDGSVINFSYELNNFKPLIKKGVFYVNYFSYAVPVRKTSFSIIYPEGLKLNLYLHKTGKSAVSKKNIYIKNEKYIKLSLSFNNIPAIKKEAYMPPLKNFRKYIAVSTYTSWSSLLKNISALFAGSEKPSEKIKKFVNSAIKKSADKIGQTGDTGKIERQKAASIYYRFVKNFRYIGLGYGINGYKPAPASRTFLNGYGDSKSLAALLITMLKISGIDAYPVLLTSLNTSDFNYKSISPKQFDSVIVGITIKEKGKNKTLYLYPDSSSYGAFKLPFSLADRKGIALPGRGIFKFIVIPSENASWNEKVFLFNGSIDKDGTLKGKASMIYKGVYSNFERSLLKNMNGYKKRIKVFDFLYNFIPGAHIKNFKYKNVKKINKNIKLSIHFSDEGYGALKAGKLIFHSVMPTDSGLLSLVLKHKRLYPLIIGYPFEHKAEIRIKLPAKYRIYYLPHNLKYAGKIGYAYSSCSLSKNKDELDCNYKFISKKPSVSKGGYKKYREIIRAYLQYLKNSFIALSNIYFY